MLVYNKNLQGKFDIMEESYIEYSLDNNGTMLSECQIPPILINTVDSELEAQAFIEMEENMIFKMECQEALLREFENNLENI